MNSGLFAAPRYLSRQRFISAFLREKAPELWLRGLVDDTGLEPVTLRTSSGCSYQLS